MTIEAKLNLKKKSSVVTDGPDRAAARAMLRATGLDDDDMNKPFVAVANLASDVTPCNVHLDRQARKVKEGLRAANSVPFLFGTITISDGISMGTEGMKASLVSREVIADSIETVTFGESMDGLVVVAACDKNMPGAMIAIARLNVPPFSSTAAPSCPETGRARTSTSKICSKPLAPIHRARST